MNLEITVIVCTHNPRPSYIARVMSSLQAQTLSVDQWELLLVDNASDKLLASEIDLSWHSQSRHIREEELGLTPARLRGIAEAVGETLVFVDDDNVLDPNYLEVVLAISKSYSYLGAWGGQVLPEFEVSPPEWTKPFWGYLALREVHRDQWSNLLHQLDTTPHGAGLCVRKSVAEQYAINTKQHPLRSKLGRRGESDTDEIPLSCEDTDLAYTACDNGLGTGLFTSLKLTHLIPKNRLTREYLVRLVKGTTYSQVVLESMRNKFPAPPDKSLKAKLSEIYRLWRMHPEQRHLHRAVKQGAALAIKRVLNKELASNS